MQEIVRSLNTNLAANRALRYRPLTAYRVLDLDGRSPRQSQAHLNHIFVQVNLEKVGLFLKRHLVIKLVPGSNHLLDREAFSKATRQDIVQWAADGIVTLLLLDTVDRSGSETRIVQGPLVHVSFLNSSHHVRQVATVVATQEWCQCYLTV